MIRETGSLSVRSGTEAGGGFEVAAGCSAGLDWEGLELFFLALGLAVVDWVWACGGGLEVGGAEEGVALVVGLDVGAAVTPPPAVTAAARDELGWEVVGASWFVTGGVGMTP